MISYKLAITATSPIYLVICVRTYNGIYLGPTGNRQGTVNVFNLGTGKVKNPRTIVSLPVLDRIIETVNIWGRKFQKETRIHKIYFINRHQNKYAWDNDDLDYNDKALVEDNVPQPHLAAEMPGVDLASETTGVSQGISFEGGAIKIINPIQEQLVQSAIHNNSLSVAGPDRKPGVSLVKFANDEDIVDSSQECGVLPKREPKVEVTTDVDLDSASDNESVTEDDTVNKDQFSEELITPPPAKPGSTTNTHGLCRSTCTSRPPQATKVSFQNKRYDLDWWNKVVQGTNHLNVYQRNNKGKSTGGGL